jgi:alpha-tubulin suppressor-like RCC1 family protein
MAGERCSYSLKSDGSLWAWGLNFIGNLGDNTSTDKSSPVLVVGNHSFIEAFSGGFSTSVNILGRKSDGSVWCWGANSAGQIGDNTTTDKSSPVLVVGNHSFIKISCTGLSSYGLKSDGSIWGWGTNSTGQLGTNNIISYSSPVMVVGNHSFVGISSGLRSVFGRKANGELWGWGENTYGQLGDNTIDVKSSPVLVVGNHSFINVYLCGSSCVALKANGEAWTWGYNNYGQLGDNTVESKSSPVLVVGNHSFIKIAGGASISAALKSDGSVWTWGYNFSGYLGDNTLDNKSSPVLVVGNHSFIDIYSDNLMFAARKSDGSLWTWGYNVQGSLGDNTQNDKSSPVLVVGNHNFAGRNLYPQRLFIDGFENGSLDLWTEVSGNFTATNAAKPSGFTGNYYASPQGDDHAYMRYQLPKAIPQVYVSYRFYNPNIQWTTNRAIFSVRNSSNSIYFELLVGEDSILSAVNGEIEFTQGTKELSVQTVYHIQMWLKPSTSGGGLIIKVNNIIDVDYIWVLSESNIQTINFGYGGSYNTTNLFDDIVIDSTVWPGVTRIQKLNATCAGTFSEWIASR